MTATPLRSMSKDQLDALALTAGEEITVTMKLDQYHAIQKSIAEGNFTRGQTEGQRQLISYLFHIIVTEELSADALVFDRLPTETVVMLKETLIKMGKLKYETRMSSV